MTLTTTLTRKFASGNGVITAFDFSFRYLNPEDIKVYVDGVLINTSAYTLVKNPDGNGGTVTFSVAPVNGTTVLIQRQVAYTQENVIPTVDKLGKGLLEATSDKVMMAVQQVKEITDRCLKIAFSQNVTPDTEMVLIPNKAVIVNATGDGFTTSADDFVNAEASATAAAASAVAAANSASAASGSASAASVSAAAAAASAVNAAASAASAAAIVGISGVAAVSDVLAGTNSTKVITPVSLAGLWAKGSDIASAATLSIPSTGGGYFNVTGTTGITKIDQGTSAQLGRSIKLKFTGGLTLTNNTKILLPGGGDIFTAAGDVAEFVCEDTTASNQIWRCILYTRASGLAVIRSGIVQIVQTVKTDTFTTSSNTFVDVTGLSVTITPTSASSKILVIASLALGSNAGVSAVPQVLLLRGSTGLRLGDVAGSRTQISSGASIYSNLAIAGCDITYLDSPASTSPQTYKIQLRDGNGTGAAQYINQSHTDTNSATAGRAASSLIVQEFL